MSRASLTPEKRAKIAAADTARATGERKAPVGGILTKSLSIDWWTPPRLVEAVKRYQPIALDPATHHSNPTGAKAWVAPPADGLAVDWDAEANRYPSLGGLPSLTFVNPPYGKALRAWLSKIVAEADHGTHLLVLLPCARFEQAYMHDVLSRAHAICWVRKRVAFIRAETGDAVGGNAYASMFLLFNGDFRRFALAMDGVGLVQRVES